MINELFLVILNMSITASFVIIVILLARYGLKKAPKIFSYVLWSVVLFRLVCPISLESVFSLIPKKSFDPNTVVTNVSSNVNINVENISSNINQTLNNNLGAINDNHVNVIVNNNINYFELIVFIISMIWLIGFLSMVIYNIIGYAKLEKQLNNSINLKDNIYTSTKLNTGFVMGVINPRIYLPAITNEKDLNFILLHEQYHIKRKDHLSKLVSLLVLCIHWFNPLVWLSFKLSSQDMEMSCDEAVIKSMGSEIKKDYSYLLLSMASSKRQLKSSMIGFGDNDTKLRIKNLLNYKTLSFKVVLVIIITLFVGCFCLMTNPIIKETISSNNQISFEENELEAYVIDEYNSQIIANKQILDKYIFVAYQGNHNFGYVAFRENNLGQWLVVIDESFKNDYSSAPIIQNFKIDDNKFELVILNNNDPKATNITRTVNYIITDDIKIEDDAKVIFEVMVRDNVEGDYVETIVSNENVLASSETQIEYDFDKMWQYKTDEVNNEKVVQNIIDNLKFPQFIEVDNFKIDNTDDIIKVSLELNCTSAMIEFYKNENSIQANHQPLINNAILMFNFIENVEVIEYILNDENELYPVVYKREQFVDDELYEYFRLLELEYEIMSELNGSGITVAYEDIEDYAATQGEIFAREEYNDEYIFLGYIDENGYGWLIYSLQENGRWIKNYDISADFWPDVHIISYELDGMCFDIIIDIDNITKINNITRTINGQKPEVIQVDKNTENTFVVMPREYNENDIVEIVINGENKVNTKFNGIYQDYQELYKYKSESITKEKALDNIISNLNFSSMMEYDGFKVNSYEPLDVTIDLTIATNDLLSFQGSNFSYDVRNPLTNIMASNAILMFMLIEDIERVNFELTDGENSHTMIFDNEQLSKCYELNSEINYYNLANSAQELSENHTPYTKMSGSHQFTLDGSEYFDFNR